MIKSSFDIIYNGVPLSVWDNGRWFSGCSDLDNMITESQSFSECLKEVAEIIDYWLLETENVIESCDGYEVLEPCYNYNGYFDLSSEEEKPSSEPISKEFDDPIPF